MNISPTPTSLGFDSGTAFAPVVYAPAVNAPAVNAGIVTAPAAKSPAALLPPARTPLVRDLVDVWDVPFDRVTLEEAVSRISELILRRVPSYVITANLNYAMLHHQQLEMRRITAGAALILADGQPIVWRSRLGEKPLPERVAGSEMIYRLAETARNQNFRIYFLGGELGVARACADRLVQLYPGLQVAGVESPPFRKLTDAEQLAQDHRIRSAKTDLLLVAFGQPKGERWIFEHHERLGVPVSIQLGASFDFVAGIATRAPSVWQRIGMEWAYRMLSDPKRLVPRYASNASYLLHSIVEDWKRQVTRWGMGNWSEHA